MLIIPYWKALEMCSYEKFCIIVLNCFPVPYYRAFARQLCCIAEAMKMFCIRNNIFSHRKKNLLFLPYNMAALQNLYTPLILGEFSPPPPLLFLSPLLFFSFFFLSPQPGFGSITLLQKFTPHFKILDPRVILCLF